MALRVRELARPLEFVVAVHESCADPPEERHVSPFVAAKKVPLAPLDGAVKVTVAPETGLEELSVTRATSGFVKFVLTVVVWLPPDEMAIVAAVPAVLVSEKLSGLGVVPGEVAPTL